MTAIDIAIVGVGKIARDQHLPSIEGNPDFRLAATVSGSGGIEGVENFETLDALLSARPDIPALALCMPPQVRFAAAATAIAAGRHVLLEKPPGATIAEVETLKAMAAGRGVALFATWHSRFAAGVEPAREWLARRTVERVRVTWKEDVRRWHPGQEWIWRAGGFGVFDPGINAMSIVTAILPMPVHLTSAELEFPEGRDAPIGARLKLTDGAGAEIEAEFDWRQEGPQTWTVEVAAEGGLLVLSQGGAVLDIVGKRILTVSDSEYSGIYARFAELVRAREIDVDLAPLVHVADAFMLGRRIVVDPFVD